MPPTALPAPGVLPRSLEPAARGLRIGVVVPAFRVANEIERVLAGIPAFIETVIVVDDASPDDTAARVERCADPRVVLVRHAHNRGVGGASTTGFREALLLGLDVVVKMDGDDQMDPAELPRLLEPVLAGRADAAKGNRYDSIGSLAEMPLLRVLGNGILTFLVKLASGYWNVFDPANGYLALRADLLRKLDLERLPPRYFFESGLLIELGILRAVVADVPIPARYGDERSSLSIPRTVLGFPPRLVWGLLRRFFWRYLVKDFSAVSVFVLMGVPMLLFGFVYGSRAYLHMLETGVPATAGMVMLSAMPIILGVQLLLQAVVLDVQNVPTQPITAPLARA
jgi:glycosyltransferase involved in cell wall biosynthesis